MQTFRLFHAKVVLVRVVCGINQFVCFRIGESDNIFTTDYLSYREWSQ